MRQILVSALLFFLLVGNIPAQSTPEDLPDSVLLTGLTLYWQDRNRCSAAALSIQLSYWRDDIHYEDTLARLNPNSGDVSVRFDEMIAYAETFGLRGVARMGGTTDILKRLVVGGFPVLVENGYYDGEAIARNWTSHNRVVVGYDDTAGVLYVLDSVLGGGEDDLGRAFEYAEFEAVWRQMNHNYLVLYEPEDESQIQAILGQQWDTTFNAEWTLARAQANLYTANPDAFDNFNMGTALVALGEYERALQAFGVAERMGLPWRMLWYQFGPFEAYLQTGNYAEVRRRTQEVLTGNSQVEEMYYYLACAYVAEGNQEQARINLEAAIWRNPYYTAASDLLAQVQQGKTAGTTP